MSELAEGLRALKAIEVLAVRDTVRFAYCAGDRAAANRHLAEALRTAGFLSLRYDRAGTCPAIDVDTAEYARPERAEALCCATVALGAIAANGRPVPARVVANIQPDGLPAYNGFAGLWRLEADGLDIPRLGRILDARVAADPRNADALMDTATLLFLTLEPTNRAAALTCQRRALQLRRLYQLPARCDEASLRVLVLAGPGDMTANTPLDCLLEDAPVELTTLYIEAGRPSTAALPPHDAVFFAIGESPTNRVLLSQLVAWAAESTRPVLNRPERILQMSRDRVSALLQGAKGIVMPVTAAATRDALLAVVSGARRPDEVLPGGIYPIIARPYGSQGGKGLAKLADAEELRAYLREAQQSDFYVSRFVDYRSGDGLYRKYRVVFVDGRPYACHMAISANWMIHYVNAGMDESAAKRAEEARFMAHFDAEFGARHAAALESVQARLALDYFGIDCAETADGRLLVFEADGALLVHNFDPPDLYPYKGPHMRRISAAFVEMLGRRVSDPLSCQAEWPLAARSGH